ncbi:hypothetical protein [Halorientalis salina]|uniref:hypothetical protein n=1 Tax=Halorientalis salina TaxID=2932266 RepID=UPI0010AD3670|nr:hypothetical protein [Halorientalis salina]
MVDVTLVELHLEDASFSAKAPFSGEGGESSESGGGATEVSIGEEESTGDGPSKLLLAVIGLGLLGGVGWWLKRGRMPDIDEELEVTP